MTLLAPEEFRLRFDKVIAGMAARGLDGLVVIDIERPTLSGNIRYLTNYFNTLPNLPAALVITPTDMTLCVAPGFFGSQFRLAREQAPWLKNIFGSSPHFFKPNLGPDIINALGASGFQGRRVGLDGLGLVSEGVSKSIRTALKNYEIVEETGIIERVRLLKSEAEIPLLREASRLTDVGVTAFMNSIKAGIRFNVAIGKGEEAGLTAGADEVSVYMASGIPWIWGKFHGPRTFYQGDMVCAEFNVRHAGYYGQVGRTFTVGKASEPQHRAYETAVQAYRAMADLLKPGVTAAELFLAGERVVTSAGYGGQKLRSGHGMGLTYGEGFDIDIKDRTVMQPGFYVMFHVMVAVPDAGPYAFVGNALLVTDLGSQELNKAELRLELE